MVNTMSVQFVSAAVGLIVENNNVLMIKREKEPFANLWSIPGGKIEKKEFVSTAVLREINEEVGGSCYIEKFLGTVSEIIYNDNIIERHHIIHVFKLRITNGEPIESVKWYSIDKIDQKKDITPSDIAIIEEFLVHQKSNYFNCSLHFEKGKYTLGSFSSLCIP